MDADANSEPNVQQVVPFLRVSNMGASVSFYVEGLGFQIKQKWVDAGVVRWCRLQHGSAFLMLQEFRTEGHDSWVPESKVGVGVTLYYLCNDALSLYREVVARGIDAATPFVSNGMWYTTIRDPDGYEVAFESATDVPEGTIYTGS